AVKTGRRKLNELDPVYLTKCQNEVIKGAGDQLRRAQNNAYGTSFPFEAKRNRDAGWYFSSERAFDIAVAYQLFPRPDLASDPRRTYSTIAGATRSTPARSLSWWIKRAAWPASPSS